MSKAEIMVIMILFHSSGYRCLKHFYLDNVCKHMSHLFLCVYAGIRGIHIHKTFKGIAKKEVNAPWGGSSASSFT